MTDKSTPILARINDPTLSSSRYPRLSAWQCERYKQ